MLLPIYLHKSQLIFVEEGRRDEMKYEITYFEINEKDMELRNGAMEDSEIEERYAEVLHEASNPFNFLPYV
jgi:hypothetical protein